MKIRRASMAPAMAVVTLVTCIALPPRGRSQTQDPPSNQVQSSDGSQDKKQADKKDTTSDGSEHIRVSTPMRPLPKAPDHQDSSALAGKKDDSDGTKDIKTPIAVRKSPAGDEQKAAQPNVPNWKVKDLGDTVRFEFPTPLGPNVWTKKKSELNAREKLALANASPATAEAGTPKDTSDTPKK